MGTDSADGSGTKSGKLETYDDVTTKHMAGKNAGDSAYTQISIDKNTHIYVQDGKLTEAHGISRDIQFADIKKHLASKNVELTQKNVQKFMEEMGI